MAQALSAEAAQTARAVVIEPEKLPRGSAEDIAAALFEAVLEWKRTKQASGNGRKE